MFQKADGQSYAPIGKSKPVCPKGSFPIGVIGLDHGHIYGMCNGLSEAGATILSVWDPDAAKVAAFIERFPEAKSARCENEVLENPAIRLIACASIPSDRAEVGMRVLEHGKDFFVDKPPLITREQLALARKQTQATGLKYCAYYSERLHVEAAVHAEALLQAGAIGKVVQVMGWGPHRAAVSTRPPWFFEPSRYGGILVDIGCHQIEQILFFGGAEDASIQSSRIANYAHPEYPRFQDFGDATLTCSNGVSGYFRVDWFTPDGLRTWGDGRTLIVGTDGYIELRKYVNIAADPDADHVFLVNHEGEQHFNVSGQCGFPFFGRLILDCLNRTETAMTQAHVFRAIELALDAQEKAADPAAGSSKPVTI